MIEHTDVANLVGNWQNNKLGISDPWQLAQAEAHFTALRLGELRAAPISAGFDRVHLEAIHRHIYQDLYDWAGKLGAENIGSASTVAATATLDAILDRLAREDYLKGRSADQWSRSASEYILEIAAARPFEGGNEIALREFAEELARKNNLSLQWSEASERTTHGATDGIDELRQSLALRRTLMFAMDTGPCPLKANRDTAMGRDMERLLAPDKLLP